MVTINDVSKRAGVSRSTVSRIIADNGYVSDSARKAVEEAIAELGYRPNALARGLRSNRSDIIGAVVVDVASPFYSQMVGGMQTTCRANGKSILVQSGFAQPEDEARAIVELLDRSCDGLILYLENPLSDEMTDIIRRSQIPVVVIGGDEMKAVRASIHIDNFSGARAGMRHLFAMGHRRIAYLSGGLMYRDTRERLRGIDAALAEEGMTRDDIYLEHGDFTEQWGFDGAQRLLASGTEVTAIFCGDDDVSAGAMLALKQAGLRVPEDISILGFDDNFHARHLTPGLTTIRQPVGAAGQAAVNILLKIFADEPVGETEITIPTELVLRQSVADISRATEPREAALATD